MPTEYKSALATDQDLEALTLLHLLKRLHQHALFQGVGETHSCDEVRLAMGLPPQAAGFSDALLKRLVQAGFLDHDTHAYRAKLIPPAQKLAAVIEEQTRLLLQRCPASEEQISALGQSDAVCGMPEDLEETILAMIARLLAEMSSPSLLELQPSTSNRPFLSERFSARRLTLKALMAEPVASRFDLILCAPGLCGQGNLSQITQQLAQRLAPAGMLILCERVTPSLPEMLAQTADSPWWNLADSEHRLGGGPWASTTTWRACLDQAGLETAPSWVEQRGLSSSHDILLARNTSTAVTLPASAAPVAVDPAPRAVQASTPAVIDGPVTTSPASAADGEALSEGLKHIAVSIFQVILKLDASDIDTALAFSDYGVESIASVVFIEELNKALAIKLRPTVLFDYTSIDQLVAYIAKRYGADLQPRLRQFVVPVVPESDALDLDPAPPPVVTPLAVAQPQLSEELAPQDLDRIAIIGYSGRFPMAADPESFWANLAAGRDCVSEIPAERWDWRKYYHSEPGRLGSTVSKWGGFLDEIDRFDPSFFNISGAEAEVMDPQQRLFLEEAYRALDHAGYARRGSAGRKCAVFVGVEPGDYRAMMQGSGKAGVSGNADAVLAARISYFLDLKGPSMAVNTACSSSLVAMHLAWRSLRDGECDMALAGGVRVSVSPLSHIALSELGMFSPVGRCKTFDESADGFAPGEAVGAIVLKPYSAALRDGDPVHGLILACATNQDGKTNGLTAPSSLSQTAVELECYQRAGIDPRSISMVEAHGTGTKLGDPIEVEALTNAFAQFTADRGFCALGSVKTNIGHTMAAAGVASVLKVLLAFQHQAIPATLNVHQDNPYIDFASSPFYLVTHLQPWLKSSQPRRAAVSGFGFSGTNAHMVLEEPPPRPTREHSPAPAYLLPLSANDVPSLRRRIAELKPWLMAQAQRIALSDLAYTLGARRDHLRRRCALVVNSLDAAIQQLQQLESASDLRFAQARKLSPADQSKARQACADLAQASDHSASLGDIARHYEAGADLAWSQLYPEPLTCLALPSYPFARERYWAIPADYDPLASTAAPSTPQHPLLHQRILDQAGPRYLTSLAGLPGIQVQEGQVRLEPGQALAVLLATLSETSATAELLRDLAWDPQLRLPLASVLETRTVEGRAGRRLELAVQNGRPLLRGFFGGRAESVTSLDVTALNGQLPRTTPAAYLYARSARAGQVLPPTMLERIRHGAGEALLTLAVQDDGPALTNGVLEHSLVGALVLSHCFEGCFLPRALERLQIQSPGRVRYVHVRRNGERFQLNFHSGEGQCLFSLSGLHLHLSPRLTADQQRLFFRPVWRALPAAQPLTLEGHALLFDNDEQFASQVRKAAPQLQLTQVRRGTRFAKTVRGFELDPSDAASLDRLLDEVQPDFILHHFHSEAQCLEEELEQGFIHYFALTRALVRRDADCRIPSLFLYRLPASCSHGVVAAYLRTLWLEYPELPARALGYDQFTPALLDELSLGNERDLRYRAGQRQARVLERFQSDQDNGVRLRQRGVYLITGGAGELGQIFTEYLARNYGARLVLMGRHEPDDAARALFAELEQSGAEILWFKGDVTRAEDADAAVALAQERFGALHGVLHGAMLVRDGFIVQKSRADLRTVLAPKVQGLHCLDAACAAVKLDFFACFSSMVAVLGNPGQADYAYANAYMGGYMEQRQRRVASGQCSGASLSIDWSLWHKRNMGEVEEYERRKVAALGLVPLDIQTGLEIFEEALRLGETQLWGGLGNATEVDRKPFLAAQPQPHESLYLKPSWQNRELPLTPLTCARLLLFDADETLALQLQQTYPKLEILRVLPGMSAGHAPNAQSLEPGDEEGYRQLLAQFQPEMIVHHWSRPDLDLATSLSLGIFSILHLCRALLERGQRQRLPVLYLHPDGEWPAYNAVAAFALTLQQENPHVAMGTLCSAQPSVEDVAFWAANPGEQIWRRVGSQRQARVLEAHLPVSGAPCLKQGGVYLISGGVGKLGMIFARHLAKTYGARLILCGRKAMEPAVQAELQALERLGAQVLYHAADLTDPLQANALVDAARARFGSIDGVIHAAGLVDNAFLLKKEPARFERVLAPKVAATVALDQALGEEKLAFFFAFSSIAAVLPEPGQSDYAYANHFLDAFCSWREEQVALGKRHGKTTAVNWQMWCEVGAAAALSDEERRHLNEATYAVTGLPPLEREQGLAMFEQALAQSSGSWLFAHGRRDLLERRIEKVYKPVVQTVGPTTLDRAALYPKVESWLKALLAELFRIPLHKFEPDVLFSEYGVDSMLIGQFNSRIERELSDLPATLLFEYTTLADLAGYLCETQGAAMVALLDGAAPTPAAQAETPWPSLRQLDTLKPKAEHGRSHEDIAVIGLSGSYPQAPNLEQFWRNLVTGHDAIERVPASRWDMDAFYDPDPEQAEYGKIYCPVGGFVADVDHFDPLFFQISPREAESMDPQERLFLQCAWHALEDAGYARSPLLAERGRDALARTGVFVGVTHNTYELIGVSQSAHGQITRANSMQWSIANRVSYYFNFQGPSLPVDTACSASLSALHLACESIQRGECDMALAGGVNLHLHPAKYIGACMMRMLSASGHCHSFGAEADGFVPGEGVGVAVLKPLGAAERDQDPIYGLIKGTSVNHGGKTNGFTVPNPAAQAALVQRALDVAGIDPRTLSYVETHGTGTVLGDPVEVAGLTKVFRERAVLDPQATGYCGLGSLKSNIGHLESAAGIAGLTKILLQFRHRQLVPTLHATVSNPRIAFASSPFVLQQQLAPWQEPVIEGQTYPLRAGLSSFGAGGANAHAVLEAYSAPEPERAPSIGPELVVLSARSRKSLNAYASRMAAFLSQNPVDLRDLAYTLRMAREPMEYRLALVAADVAQLRDELARVAVGEQSSAVRFGTPEDADSSAAQLVRSHLGASVRNELLQTRNWQELAGLFCIGIEIPWSSLADASEARRISLPGYPFAEERYWVETRQVVASTASNLDPFLQGVTSAAQHPAPVGQGNVQAERLFLRHSWRQQPAAQPLGQLQGTLLIFDREANTANRCRETWPNLNLIRVVPGSSYHRQDNLVTLDPREPAHFQRLLETVRPDALIHQWAESAQGLVQALDHGVLCLLHLFQALQAQGRNTPLPAVYVYDEGDRGAHAAIPAFLKTYVQEQNLVQMRAIALGQDTLFPLAELCQHQADWEVLYRGETRFVRQLERDTRPLGQLPLRQGGVYLISGGVGGLGQVFASWLARDYAARLVLLGRSALDAEKQASIECLRELGAEVLYLRLDISDRDAVIKAVAEVCERFGTLHGVFHAAGITGNALLQHKSAGDLAAVLAAKLHGCAHLDEAVGSLPLDFFMMCSSIAALVPETGQSDYAYANRFLDAFAQWRECEVAAGRRHGKTLAINWQMWQTRGIGSAAGHDEAHLRRIAEHSAALTGLPPLLPEQGLELLRQALRHQGGALLAGLGYGSVLQRRFERLARPLQRATGGGKLPERAELEAWLRLQLAELLKLPQDRIENRTPFADYGIDSLHVASFNTRLEAVVANLPATLLYEHKHIEALAEFLWREHGQALNLGGAQDPDASETFSSVSDWPELSAPVALPVGSRPRDTGAIAIIGLAGRYPDAPDLETFWTNLLEGRDSVREIPKSRWDMDHYYDPDPEQAVNGKIYCRWGAFLEGVDLFDPLFFQINPREAEALDPQERLFLQTAWHALEDAGYARGALFDAMAGAQGVPIGVYVGVTHNTYELLGQERIAQGQLVRATSVQWSVPNRVSYSLDLCGPSMPVDTACSASLSALHLACDSLRAGDCEMALAGGVNLHLHPAKYLGACAAQMLSPTGHCHSFGAAADGFVQGEGVGAVLLKPLHAAERDGDPIHGLIIGSAVNHGGRTNSFTVPNPMAQAELVRKAQAAAGIEPQSVSYLEAHGTGTALGDPIEVSGLVKAFGPSQAAYCALGSLKANIGHLESAAGIAALTKVLLQMRHRQWVPSLHADELNPRIQLAGTPFQILKTSAPWRAPVIDGVRQKLRAGISSFGAGGANAHIIVEAYENQPATSLGKVGPELILLSARGEERLRHQARQLAEYLRQKPETQLPELAYTLQACREAMPERLAFVANSVAEAAETLEAFAAKGMAERLTYASLRGQPREDEAASRYLAACDWARLMELWTQGVTIPWLERYAQRRPQRLRLPSYPFARKRYWLPDPSPQGKAMAAPQMPVQRSVETMPLPATAATTYAQEDLFYAPVWRPQPLGDLLNTGDARIFVLGGEGLAQASFALLGTHVTRVHFGESWSASGERVTLRRDRSEDWAQLVARQPDALVVLGKGDPDDIFDLLALSQALAQTALIRTLPILYVYALNDSAEPCGIAAFARVVAQEHPRIQLRTLGVEQLETAPLAEELWQRETHAQVRWVQDQRQVLELVERSEPSGELLLRQGGVYLITGGMGGLGMIFARMLARTYRARLVLLGRSPLCDATRAHLDELEGLGAEAHYLRADLCDQDELARALAELRQRCGQINGVIHAAGLLDNGYLVHKQRSRFAAVLAAKCRGSQLLDAALADEKLDFFFACSSVAALLPEVGQCDYAYANAYLDQFCRRREDRRLEGVRHGKTVALNWQMWAQGGMKAAVDEEARHRIARETAELTGLAPLAEADGLRLLQRALAGPSQAVLAARGVRARLEQRIAQLWSPYLSERGAVTAGLALEPIQTFLHQLIAELFKLESDELDDQLHLSEYGIDSLIIGEFNSRIATLVPGLPKTLLFQYETVADLATHLHACYASAFAALLGGAEARAAVPEASVQPLQQRFTASICRDIAVIGMAGRYADAPDLDAFWQNLADGRDSVGEVPAQRWDVDRYFDPNPEQAQQGKIYCKWGSWLEGVDLFDPLFFQITPREAEILDPQERLFLQTAWHALEDGGYARSRRARLLLERDANKVGVFVGVTHNTYEILGIQNSRLGQLAGAQSREWSIANRVSYFFNFRGPSMPVDTACSASLSALHLAVDSMRKGECAMALVGGVNLHLHPAKITGACMLRMLSPTGRCHSFGADADGFVPGEGVGALLLKPLDRAQEDGDRILALVKGSAINHGGRTNGFTVPSPAAQAELVRAALADAGLTATSIDYLEAHGTGTALGDPVEIQGLFEVFANAERVALGSVKSNIGHLESAAGIAGLTKIVLMMRHRQLVPSLHAETVNPAIDFEATPFRLQRQQAAWSSARPGQPLRAGISSFGAGGANAHVILESWTAPEPKAEVKATPQLIILSARDRERLVAVAAQYATLLEAPCDLADLAYTLQLGREEMEERLALIATTPSQLSEQLRAFVARGESPCCATVDQRGRREVQRRIIAEGGSTWLEARLKAGDLETLAALWRAGADLDWRLLWPEPRPLMALPLYPFARESYWVKLLDETSVQASSAHPLVQHNRSGLGGLAFASTLEASAFFLRDHQVQGSAVLPGVAYLEMAASAMEQAGQVVHRLGGVVWARPLTVADQMDVQILLEREGDAVRFRVCSAEGSLLHVQGKAYLDEPAPARFVNLAEIRSRCKGSAAPAEIYEGYRAAGLVYGPSFQVIREASFGPGEVLARLELAETSKNTAQAYRLHPALMDGALQCMALMGEAREAGLGLPFALGELNFERLPVSVFAHVRLSESERAVRKYHISLMDCDGRVLVELRDFSVRPLHGHRAAGKLFALTRTWQPQAPSSLAPLSGSLLVLDPESKLVDALRQGAALSLVHACPGMTYSSVPLRLTPTRIEHWQNLLAEVQPDAMLCHLARSGQDLSEALDASQKSVFALVRAVLERGLRKPFDIVFAAPELSHPAFRALAAFAASLKREQPLCSLRCVFGATPHQLLAEFGAAYAPAVRYVQGQRQVRSLAVGETENAPLGDAIGLRPRGVYLISGGGGALGMSFAAFLIQRCQARVVLMGRRELDAATEARLAAMGDQVSYVRADVSRAEAVAEVMATTVARFGALHGVIHAAGVIEDAFLLQKTPESVERVLAPKIYGLAALEAATRGLKLDFLVSFSSVAGLWGNTGQADYAFANAYLDACAEDQPQRLRSIAWPLWEQGGMGVASELVQRKQDTNGLMPLPTSVAFDVFEYALTQPASVTAVAYGDPARFASVLETQSRREVATPTASTAAPQTEAVPDARLLAYLVARFAEVTKLPEARIKVGEALEKYGVDSLVVMAFTDLLERDFGDLSKTLLFEYQTLLELAEYFQAQHGATLARLFPATVVAVPQLEHDLVQAQSVTESARDPEARFEEIAVIGLFGRYPGAEDPAQFWENLSQGRDSITEIPAERWDASRFYAAEKGTPGKSYNKWGGFLDGVDMFDPLFFGISPRDAVGTDPQERLFLETVWQTCEDAGYSRSALQGRNIAVFVGVMYGQYQLFGVESARDGVIIPLSSSYSSIANRVSWFFDWHGPSVALDTMCSSSLTALHLACQSLHSRESEYAVAGGVNLTLHPHKDVALSQGRFVASDGRCKSFGIGGDGYVPGEGVGAVLLKPWKRAEADGDHIYGVIRATGINHGGKTNGYNVPNPKAQGAVIAATLERANLDPATMGYLEAHGTGTSLGDPIEINGLVRAYGERHKGALPLASIAIGSAKSNIGHLESAAGIAGLTKILLQLKHGQLAPSLHAETTNPHIAFAQTPFRVQRVLSSWPQLREERDGRTAVLPRRAGLSSFGAGGANAHVVVEEARPRPAQIVEPGPWLFVFSARCEDALKERLRRFVAYLKGEGATQAPADVAHTLMVGRESLECRLALVADSLSSCLRELEAQLAGGSSAVLQGRAGEDAPAASEAQAALVARDLSGLARLFVSGAEPAWSRLFMGPLRRLPLPVYPFQKRRFWFDDYKLQDSSRKLQVPEQELVPSLKAQDPSPSLAEVEVDALVRHRAQLAEAEKVYLGSAVTLEIREGHIGLIRMEDRENKNMFTEEIVLGLMARLSQAQNHPDVRVIIVTGYDNIFSMGGTRKELLELGDSTRQKTFADLDFVYTGFLRCDVPVITAIQGHAQGGGLVLGLYGDIVVMSEEHLYSAIFTRYGFTPGLGATFILRDKLGDALGTEMMMTATTYSGSDLARRGAGVRVRPADKVLEECFMLARSLAEKPAFTLRTLKRGLADPKLAQLPAAIASELQMHGQTFHHPEVKERIARLIPSDKPHEKREQVQEPGKVELLKPAAPLAVSAAPLETGPVMAKLTALLCEALLLQESEIGPASNFADLGLDSVTGVELTHALNQAFGLTLDAASLYDHPNLAALAAFILSEQVQPRRASLPSEADIAQMPEPYREIFLDANSKREMSAPGVKEALVLEAQQAPTVAVESTPGLAASSSALETSAVLVKLRQLFCDALLLQPEELRPQSNFADLGLDSVTGVELTHALNQAFGLTLDAASLYDHPTLEALAAFLVAQQSRPSRALPTAAEIEEMPEVYRQIWAEANQQQAAEFKAQAASDALKTPLDGTREEGKLVLRDLAETLEFVVPQRRPLVLKPLHNMSEPVSAVRELLLNPMDYAFLGEHAYPMRGLFYFENRLDHEQLRRALDQVTRHYYPLCGRLVRRDGQRYAIRIERETLPFEEVVYQERGLLPIVGDTQSMRPFLVDFDPGFADRDLALFRLFQIPEGSLLSVNVSHALCDATGYYTVLAAWAAACRGQELPAVDHRRQQVQELVDRAQSEGQDDLVHGGLFLPEVGKQFNPLTRRQERWSLGREELERMSREAAAVTGHVPSENAIVTAHMWQRYAACLADDVDGLTLNCPIDFRKVVRSWSPQFFGNPISAASLRLTRDQVLNSAPGQLAQQISQAIGACDRDQLLRNFRRLDRLREREGIAAMERTMLVNPRSGLIVSNISKVPSPALDFGGGPALRDYGYVQYAGIGVIYKGTGDQLDLLLSLPE